MHNFAEPMTMMRIFAAFVMLNYFRVNSALSTPTDVLGKKSTALDVLKVLNKNSRLASYLTPSSSTSPNNNGGKGATAVVTGGNSGIGVTSIETLALAGMNVVLCARDMEGAEKVKASLPSWCQPNCRVQKLDLSDMDSIQTAAEEIKRDCGKEKISVILNNAGVMATPKRMATKQDLELQFGTNHVGHHMFTRLLLPSMNDDGRVVTVASTAHSMGQIDFSDLNYEGDRPYTPWGAYGQSKLANILFAKGLDDELKKEGSNIKSVSLHPGVIGTNLWRYTPNWTRPFLNLLLTDKTVEQGAATNVYCSIVESDAFEGGEYCMDCAISEPNANGKDESKSLRTKLWSATEDLIEKAGYELPNSLLK